MKKAIAIMLTGLMIFSAAACGKSAESTEPAPEESIVEEAETEVEEEPESEVEEEAISEPEETAEYDDEYEAEYGDDSLYEYDDLYGDDDEYEEEAGPEEAITGGFTKAESPVITDEIKALVEKATENLVGAEYTPVAYIASQVVAGLNHAVLCKIKPVTPDAKEHYAIVVIYEDLEGNAQITDILESGVETGSPDLLGGWAETESPEVTEEAAAVLTKALEELVGADYEPLALLATQVVAGTNYSFLCEITPVTLNPVPHYSIVHVYQDLEGNAKIIDTFDFTAEDAE